MSLLAIDNARNPIFSATRFAQPASKEAFNLAEIAGDQETGTALLSRLSVTNAQTQVDAQLYAQQTEIEAKPEAAAAPSAVDEFRKFLDKTPEERMISQILSSMGLTEEDLKAMTPEELFKVQKEIARRIEEKIEQATGVPAKDSASSVAEG